MAGQPNPKKVKFETEKKILDEVADEVASGSKQTGTFSIASSLTE